VVAFQLAAYLLAYRLDQLAVLPGVHGGRHTRDPRGFLGTLEDAPCDEVGTDKPDLLDVVVLEDTASAADASRQHEMDCDLPNQVEVHNRVAYAAVACTEAHTLVGAPGTSEAMAYFDGMPCTCSSAGR
jgi:hypothetical protein